MLMIMRCFALVLFFSQLSYAEPIEVKLHYIGPTEGHVWAGVQQGLSEANVQGEFLGQKYSVEVMTAEQVADLTSATALIVAVDDAETIKAIAAYPSLAEVAIMDVVSSDNSLRAACSPNVLHLSPSDKMKHDALQQWLEKHPDSKAQIQSWHKDFKKFAASQLNSRFTKSSGLIMDDDAWAGWASVKLLSDTVARIQSIDNQKILQYLKNDIAFDGQKGAGATFRETGQLRQLVLVIEDDEIAAEAPLRGVKGGLDSLGLTQCK